MDTDTIGYFKDSMTGTSLDKSYLFPPGLFKIWGYWIKMIESYIFVSSLYNIMLLESIRIAKILRHLRC